MATRIDANRVTRAPLSRDRIVRAALELADETGIESLKMRELGHVLGYEAMALYRHVANKAEVLDGILDLILTETEPPSPSGDWAEAIRTSAISIHDALDRHPWATSLLMSASHMRPARLQYMESLLGRLEEAGFSPETTYHAYHVLDAYIVGYSLWQAGHSLTAAEQSAVVAKITREISFDDFPYLAKHRDQHLAAGPQHDVNAFEVGLDLILDGLKLIRAGV